MGQDEGQAVGAQMSTVTEAAGRIVIDLKPNTWLTKEARPVSCCKRDFSFECQDQATKVRSRTPGGAGAPGLCLVEGRTSNRPRRMIRRGVAAEGGSQIRRTPSAESQASQV